MSDVCPDIPSHFATAASLIAECNPKPVIALDLDHTLWPSNCYEMTAPPYGGKWSPIGSDFPDIMGRSDVIFCTDKRTESIRPFYMYPETRHVLEFCAEHDIVLTICSRCPDVQVVEQILQSFGIWEWFLFPQVYHKRKTFHFRNLTEATGFKMKDFLFFDDDASNISMCERMGVTGVVVNKSTGLNWEAFINGLKLYKEKLHSQKAMLDWIDTAPPTDVSAGASDASVTT